MNIHTCEKAQNSASSQELDVISDANGLEITSAGLDEWDGFVKGDGGVTNGGLDWLGD